GTRGAFEELVLDGQAAFAAALVVDSSGAVQQMVRSDPDAIGYLSLGQAALGLRALPLDGIEPSAARASTGSSPLVRPFLLVTRGAARGAAADFIDFVLSPEGQALVRAQGLIPVGAAPATGS
ncbi:substrate-binding domain-containing protein, partial [Bacillus halotolerans]|uniref:substrate-binding domain-containing protein n=1 Tax=Bacillus halotolerans TaxID=260554 RepID=UPI00192E0041